eukprot:CAMPEP_0116913338 /NCGR_PEP_ID=MMETSP0467-20121206/16641_1 /TAXON_ID=283647 /ORGANISM="Mesodinium pulex, Strain SPMC105" /LENGTH=38 /DNA_ID= /DNA_START= /DNA_END= /DNA_ORIENTATION=
MSLAHSKRKDLEDKMVVETEFKLEAARVIAEAESTIYI